MQGVGDNLKVGHSLDLLGEPFRSLLAGKLTVELLVDDILDLLEAGYSFLVDTLDGSDEEIVVVHGDDRGNLSDLVVEDPPGNLLGLVDSSIAGSALEDTVHRV